MYFSKLRKKTKQLINGYALRPARFLVGANLHEDFVRCIAKYDARFKAAEPTLHGPTHSRVMGRVACVLHMCVHGT